MHFLFTLVLMLIGLSPLHSKAEPMALSPGLWEGISEEQMQFTLLQINENGEHFIFELHIPSGLNYVKRISFNDENVSCKENQCTINTSKQDELTRSITLSPYLDMGFTVLDSTYNNQKSLLSTSYRLIKQESTPTPRKFLQKFGDLLNSEESANREGPFGLWVGMLNYLDKPELVLLQLYRDKQGSLTVFGKGKSSMLTLSTQFTPESISHQHPIIEITTSHPAFATHLFLMEESSAILKGYAYATVKGIAADSGEIRLFNVMKFRSLN